MGINVFCQDCRWFDPWYTEKELAAAEKAGERDEANPGYCRKNSPRPVTLGSAMLVGVDIWPRVKGTIDWCGELESHSLEENSDDGK